MNELQFKKADPIVAEIENAKRGIALWKLRKETTVELVCLDKAGQRVCTMELRGMIVHTILEDSESFAWGKFCDAMISGYNRELRSLRKKLSNI